MADSADSTSRVKQLLSSFLSNFGQFRKRHELPRNDVAKPTGVTAETSSDGCEDASDTRNKKLYFDRVETFSPFTWFAKPVDLSPLVCAMYGWKNVEKDMLQCVNCRVFLCGQLPKPVDAVLYRDSCNRLKKSLVESHDKLCKWPLNPCPESYLSIPCHDREELLKHFQQRVKSLQSATVPKITYATVEEQGMTEETLWRIVKEIKDLESSSKDLPSVVDICALCGWSSSDSQKGILRCEYCQRKIGVWNFCSDLDSVHEEDKGAKNEQCHMSYTTNSVLFDTSNHKEVDTEEKMKENGSISDRLISNADKDVDSCATCVIGRIEGSVDDSVHQDEPRRKKQKLEKHNFDPVAEHRYWCPWLQTGQAYSAGSRDNSPTCTPLKTSPDKFNADISPAKEDTGNSADPAWLLATKILGHYISERDFSEHMKQSPQFEGLRHLRKVLQRCTSPKSQRKMMTT